jgi:hypothetical protein
MTLYRRLVDITPQQEMHLQVDHYLEPVETLSEAKIEQIILHAITFNDMYITGIDREWAAKTILDSFYSPQTKV